MWNYDTFNSIKSLRNLSHSLVNVFGLVFKVKHEANICALNYV